MANPCDFYIHGKKMKMDEFLSYIKGMPHKELNDVLGGIPSFKNIPEAPFITETASWVRLGLKTALKEAVKQGADRIAWTTGEQQNKRYDLSQHVDEVIYDRMENGGTLIAYKDGAMVMDEKQVAPEKLADYIGKEAAEKILKGDGLTKEEERRLNYLKEATAAREIIPSPATKAEIKRLEDKKSGLAERGELKGEQLQVGGKGMKGFYGEPAENKLGIVGEVAKSLFKQEPKKVKIETKDKFSGSKEDIENGTPMSKQEAKDFYYDKKGVNDGLIYSVKENGSVNELRTLADINDVSPYERIVKVVPKKATEQHSITITPELRREAESGLPLFKDIKGRGKEIADKIRTAKIKAQGIQSNIAGIPVAVWNAAVETIATAIEKGATLTSAINKAIKVHKLKDIKDYDQKEFIKKLEEATGEKFSEVSQSAEGGEPPKPPVEEMPTQEEDKNIGITHAQTAELRKEAGLPEYEKEAETFAKWDEEAKQRIKNGEMPDVIKKIENGGQPSAVEQRMMGMHIADLKEKVNESPTDENLEKYHTALKLSDKMGGSEVGKSLVARKGIFQADESLADYFEREREVNNDAPLTESQKEQVKTEYQDISEAEKAYQQKIAGLEAENARLKAEQEIKKVKRSSVKRDFGAERKQIISDIKDKLKKARGETQASIVPYAKELIAIAPDVGKLVTNLLEEGVTKLGDITDRVFEELKEHIPALTKKDVNDLIAGEYNPKKKSKNELAKARFELQQEAKLLNKLDAVLKGEQPKTEQKKRERNQALEDLRKQIKDIQGFDKEVEAQKNEALKAKAEAAKKNEKDLTDAEKEIAQKTAYQKTLEAYKRRTQKEINRIDEQIKKGDFAKEEKKQPLKLDAEARALKDKLIKLKTQREVRLMKQQYQNRSRYEKTKDWVIDKFNIPRTIMSSMDYSAPLRQGLVAGISHPRTALKASLEMFKSSFSQKNFDRWVYEMRESPRYDIMTKSGLAVTDPHSPFLAAKEEAFMNNTAEKIPIIGKLIKGSERAYVMFLNKMRADLFNRFADRFEEQGKTYDNSPELYQATAKLINAETGRGDLGKALEGAAPILNTVFFSPRLIASRVNLLTNWANPYWYKNTPKEIRVMYMKDMLKFIGLGMSVIALSKLSGADVEDDPRSSDFGKIKSGNTRWDIWGGFQQYVRLATQMAMGEKKSMRTGEIQQLDSKGRFGEGREDVIGRFIRVKLAPVPSMAIDFFKGRTVSGEPVTFGNEAQSHFLPLIYSDVQDAMKDKGVSSLFTVGVPAVFGVGVQTFNPNDTKKQKTKL